MISRLMTIILLITTSIGFTQINSEPRPKMDKKMLKLFFETHMVYPEMALKSNREGKVIIGFLIDENGYVSNQKIKKSPSKFLNTESLRLFNMIEWNPAFKDGVEKSASGELEVNYKIKKYKKLIKRRGYDNIEIHYLQDSSMRVYTRKELDTIAESTLEGGNKNLYTYIYSEMKYPKQASDLNIEGKVELGFIVESNGLPSNITVNQTVGGGCTEEALRIVNTLTWRPAIKNGLAVRSRQKIFIEFRLNGENGGKYIPNQTNSGF